MKRTMMLGAAAAALATPLALALSLAGPGAAAQEGGGKGQDAEDMQEGWAYFMSLLKPQPEHEKLAPLVGEWETTMRVLGMPGVPPSKGTATFSWLIDGRWMQEEVEGSMMGMPTRGFHVFGYDPFKQSFTGSFFSTSSQQMLTYEGDFTQDGKTLIAYGPMDEPVTGEHDKMVKYVWRMKSDDHMVFEIHDLPIGEEKTKVVELEYRRKE